MAQQLARRPVTINGKKYRVGQPVPMDQIKPERRKMLIEQRVVGSDSIRVHQGGNGKGR